MESQQSGDSDWEFDELEDENDVIFTKATQQVQKTHDKIMPNDLLQLYGLFKQATVGKCNTSKPSMFAMQARAKWSAWEELGSMSSEKAKELYVEKVKQLDPHWYEQIQKGENMSGGGGTGWVVHSIELPPDDVLTHKPDCEKTIFDFVKDRNFSKVEEMLNPSDLQALDETGLGLIHWATDANNVQILSLLLSSGCPVDLQDAEQRQTALHYATSCGHSECIRLLLQYGADKMAKDIDGQTCVDVADTTVLSLLN
ncbi:acyl-CoA-binding domain-containing protein 6 [Stomoxys calcitrans]|uniref:acyl-CoA-binding domain-containing protein 6 n=1 Tax=Stomoxys calcitrans TaxID=35570 RepID=UPI0027E32752|nr:acyl-CoA-binding domain-containing protein 6 [Stomoxys calcitrans]